VERSVAARLKVGVLAEPVLVGRERELDELQRCLDSVIKGKGATIFVSGDAGSGKTRLVHECLGTARKKGLAVMAGWCLSDAEIPFFPFIEAFNAYFASLEQVEEVTGIVQPGARLGFDGSFQISSVEREVTTLLTGPRPEANLGKPEAFSPQVWKDQAFAAVAKTLHEISFREPIILFLEDVQWADSASLALLHYIARAINNSERILIISTFRSEELTADAEGHPHPLAETLRVMRREDLFTEIKLSNLTEADVSRIAENMIGGSLESEFAKKLVKESRGNPLFIVDSLRMLSEQKSLLKEKGQWRLTISELDIPSKFKDIILRRLAVLKNVQRRVLDAASVIGEKFDAELLSNVLGLDTLDVLETLNVIAQSTSLIMVEEDRYRFDHARSRETLYEELSAPLKRGYHARIAEKIESTKKTSLPLSDLAYHYAQAGKMGKALKYALAAAEDELAKFSNAQAIKHFVYVLQNIPDDLEHAEEKRTALEGLGDAYTANSMYVEAIKTLDELASSQTGAVRLRAYRKAMDAAFLKGDKPDVLLDYARKAEELAVYDRLEMARVLDNRGRAFGFAGRGKAELDLADYDAALQIFEEENSLPDVADALWRSGIVCTMFEDLRAKGIGEMLRSIAIFRELGDIRKEVPATYHLAQGFMFSALIPEAKTEYLKVLEIGENIGSFSELAQACSGLSRFFAREGKLEEAISQDLKALTYWRKTDLDWLGGSIYGELAVLYTKLGDLQKVEEYYEKLLEMPPESLKQLSCAYALRRAKKILTAAKNNWQITSEIPDINTNLRHHQMNILELADRGDYAWALRKQGKVEEANAQIKANQKALEKAQERFEHTNVQANLMAQRKVQVEQEFEMRFDLVNISRKSGTLVRIEGAIPPEFTASNLPTFCSLQNGTIEIKDKTIGPFQVETIKLRLKATKVGSYNLTPKATYIDDSGKTKTRTLKPITITVQPSQPSFEALPNRVATGYSDLDRLLLGGIPEKYAIMLASPSNDERAMLIKKFLEAGTNAGEITFHITAEAGNVKTLAEEHPSSFYLLVCNPQADAMVQNMPNIFKLKGVESLTEIDIALTKAFRMLKTSPAGPRRICLEIVSDVLLQHHALITRKWLSALLPNLKSQGLTVLAVINPHMHSQEEVQATLGLFDGEIRISEKETGKGIKKVLRIRRLFNQKYLENELTLTGEKLEG
jgi:tetratricopeptide (TPR) repeat protein/KaiC/GvpD/RAD55 family RecA-like ATPase